MFDSLIHEFLARLRNRTRLTFIFSVALLIGISGPFGTFESMTFSERLIYWLAISLLTAIGALLFDALIVVLLDLPFWLHVALVALWMATLSPPIVRFVHDITRGGDFLADALPDYWLIFWLTFLLTVFLYLFWCILVNGSSDQGPALGRRLKAPHGRILRLSMRDHYVDVFTDQGNEAVLMRFSDAIDEMRGVDGMRVHRSHWVAADAVVGHFSRKGRKFLKLADGSEIPISRGYRAEVEAQLAAQGGISRRARLISRMERCKLARRMAKGVSIAAGQQGTGKEPG